ncbi:N-acetylneuraminate lyase [Eubacteriales bacterium mix99]|jgi:N-acetylneuraminate lyase
MKNLRGIIPALLTPFTLSGEVNKKALRQLIEMNIQKGVSAFYSCGSSAEAFLLTTDERKDILETVVDAVNGRCAVIAHIGAISQDTAIELARHAEKTGADVISSIPPFYYNFTFEEIKSYYYSIAEKVSTPILIYNFPAFSGVTLTVDRASQFLCDKRFIGVKHTSSDFYVLNRLKKTYPDKLIFNGYDEMLLSGLAAGADGGIGSTYNFMAEKYIRIMKLFQQGQMEEARKIQTEADNIIDVLAKVGVMPGEKAILTMMGLDFGECRKPFKPITAEEYEMLKKATADLL